MAAKKTTLKKSSPAVVVQDPLIRLRQAYPLLTPTDLDAVIARSQQLHDGENVYAQSLTGALRLAQMFGCEHAVLQKIEFARSSPQLFNVVLGAALALALNKDMARGHFEILISPLATTRRFAWLKEVLPA
jgi:hypothetical protein